MRTDRQRGKYVREIVFVSKKEWWSVQMNQYTEDAALLLDRQEYAEALRCFIAAYEHAQTDCEREVLSE